MASRDTIKHTISLAQPVGASIGDEWSDPEVPNVLYKRLVQDGVLTWVAIPTNAAQLVDQLRSLTIPTRPTTGRTASIGDRGALLAQTAGSVTVPANVFAPGDVFTIYNRSGVSETINQGSDLTMYLAGTASTGTRTIAQRGLATVVFISSTEAVISGAGIT
jgi:hypothetical protein